MTYFEKYGLLTSTGSDAITIDGSEGWRYISISVKSDSTQPATITSTYTGNIGGRVNGSIDVAIGESLNIGTGQNSVGGLIITVPTGCVVKIVGVKFEYVI